MKFKELKVGDRFSYDGYRIVYPHWRAVKIDHESYRIVDHDTKPQKIGEKFYGISSKSVVKLEPNKKGDGYLFIIKRKEKRFMYKMNLKTFESKRVELRSHFKCGLLWEQALD
mgnify:CR=1 FL=1|tara:strand:+ start:67892 stop:68230 length:339 start_codon:yes stop_codon:yes gene_type:complete